MVSSSSPSSSSLPPSSWDKHDGLEHINMQAETANIQKLNSINGTTPVAAESDDEKINTMERHDDEKSGSVQLQPHDQTDVPQTLSDKGNQAAHVSAETMQSGLDAMTLTTSRLATNDTKDSFESTESSLPNPPTQTNHHGVKDPAESQTKLISTNDGTTTQATLATAAGTEVEQADRNPSDNEPALSSQSEQPDPSASSALSTTTTTSSNQQKPSSSSQTSTTSTTSTTVTQQDQVAGMTVNENQNSQQQSPSLDHEYLVKSMDWLDPNTNTSRVVRIITQNENGPCPLVSICNVLFIRGDLNIRPFERSSVTFEYLLEILGDYLLNHAPSDIKTPESPSTQQLSSSPPTLDSNPAQPSLARQTTMEYVLTYRHNLDTALTILPRLQTGLDVNVQFSSIHDFEPTEELALFDLFGVDLVHGWIIDPQDEEGYRVVNKCKSYNGIVECIVRGAETNLDTNDNNNNDKGEHVDETKMVTRESNIHDGLVASQFLEDSATQLTYYGIELLTDTLPKNKLCVLFRNNHFSTLYKHPQSDRLYTLVTDTGLVSEENVVWETLGDVDQGTSEFVNSQFVRPPPTRIRPTSSSGENQDRETADLDYAIALSLQQHQHEEIARNSQIAKISNSIISPNHRNRTSDSSSPSYPQNTSTIQSTPPKKKNCIIS